MMDKPTDKSGSGRRIPPGDEVMAWRPVAHRSFEHDSDADLVSVIIEAVAAAEGIEATTITSPLFDVVNAPAIEALFFGRSGKESRRNFGSMYFYYRGFRVTVTSDGQVAVAEPVHGDDCV